MKIGRLRSLLFLDSMWNETSTVGVTRKCFSQKWTWLHFPKAIAEQSPVQYPDCV